jgi:hypothetical protein
MKKRGKRAFSSPGGSANGHRIHVPSASANFVDQRGAPLGKTKNAHGSRNFIRINVSTGPQLHFGTAAAVANESFVDAAKIPKWNDFQAKIIGAKSCGRLAQWRR